MPLNALSELLINLENRFAAKDIHFPVVVKPTHGAGKIFVRKVESFPALLDVIYNFVVFNLDYQKRFFLSPEQAAGIFVEEFIGGVEVDVDCIVEKGEILFCSINENKPAKDPYFLELGGCVPGHFDPATRARIRASAQAVVSLYDSAISGIIHFEAKVGDDGVVRPIELNLRLGGAETFDLVRAAYGVDLIRESTKLMLGASRRHIAFPTQEAFHQYACSVNFVPDWPEPRATLSSFDIDPDTLSSPSFAAAGFFYPLGTLLRLPPEATQYLGWMVAVGPAPDVAEARLQKLVAGVHYTLAHPASHLLL